MIVTMQWVVFLPSNGHFGNEPTEKFYDLTGSCTYLLSLLITYFQIRKPSTRQVIVNTAASIWSARLGWFLFSGVIKCNGIYRGFTEVKQNPLEFLVVWTL